MDLGSPFRGTLAVARGAITRHVLFGPRFQRLFPDVYVRAGVPVDLALRARAAALATAPDGVVSGWSAAELLGASCGPVDAPAEITLRSGAHGRAPAGLELHRDHLCAAEITTVSGVAVTTPARTAYDIARRRERINAVVALDALLARFCLDADDVRAVRSRHVGARGNRKLEPALQLVDLGAESPMETRIRVALHVGGLPAPRVQWPVAVAGRRFHLDLAYPAVRLGVEYDGRHHLAPSQALRDLEREGLLGTLGWTVLRFGARGTVRAARDRVTHGRGAPPPRASGLVISARGTSVRCGPDCCPARGDHAARCALVRGNRGRGDDFRARAAEPPVTPRAGLLSPGPGPVGPLRAGPPRRAQCRRR